MEINTVVVESSPLKVITDDDQTKSSPTIHDDQHPKPPEPSILTKLHAGYFRVCVFLGTQALLWKTLSAQTNTSPTLHYLFTKLPSTAFFLLWALSLFLLLSLSILYILRCIFHFSLVRAEFSNHVGVNYLFSPWICWLLLLQSAPLFISDPNKYSYDQILRWMFIVPIVVLDVKVYGQWFTTEKRFLSMAANPTSQISVIGNLVGAWVANEMGWRESSICIFTLGMTHYLVVFITLYQRLSGGNHLPARLRPVFFLFVAAPSVATLAWNSINGSFDMFCKMLFFLALFLFISLASRPTLFKKSVKKFNVAWWAFSFPLTFLALASTEYAQQTKGIVASSLVLVLSFFSVLVFLSLLVLTAVNMDALLSNTILHLNSLPI